VLELSRLAPGPFCSLLLLSLGAEVVKVEEPGRGDPLRQLDPLAFQNLNAGKKSLSLNLKSGEGRALLLRLLERTDVLLEGFRPGVMKRLGLSYEELGPRFPRLIYLSLTGYGQSGPYRERAGHDLNYMAVAGALAGEVPPIQVADFAGGGLAAALALTAALVSRERRGSGGYLDLAMLDGVLALTLLSTSPIGKVLSGLYPCYGLYATADGKQLAVGALEPKFWQAFCQGLERPDLGGRAFDTGARAEIAAALRARSLADWQAVFAGLDACVEAVGTAEQALSHPQASSRRDAWPHPSVFSSLGAAPPLGEHNRSLLRELGLTEHEVEQLRTQGVL
jgi:crotonobetainyl-CoA:carnitine CoA-transferase CaiB-like acyl-CoA transferase